MQCKHARQGIVCRAKWHGIEIVAERQRDADAETPIRLGEVTVDE
jgi:hypothetical protein